MASVTYKRYNGTSWEEIIWANHLPLSGGTMKGPLVLTGGDAASGVGNMQLDTNGQITAKGTTSTLFGRTSNTNLLVGHSSHVLNLRGSETRPTYNGNSLALLNDLSGSYIPLSGTSSLSGSIIPATAGGAINLGSSSCVFGTVYANSFNGTATNASKLGGTGKASNGYNGVITTGSDGVAEMGKHIDFHATSTDTKDYDVRFTCPSLSSGVTVTLPSSSGTIALTSQLATFSYSSGVLTITKS